MKIKISKNKLVFFNFFLLLITFILASYFRLTNLNLMEFKADEAANLLLSSRQIFGHPIPPGGTVSSVGILNPPFFNYIILPLTFFTLDPLKITFFIAFLNTLAIVGFFILVKKYYNLTIATISSVFLALSPWAILFSRKIWMQDLLIPIFILLFLSILKIIFEKKSSYWILYFSAALFLIQLHQASIFFLTPLTILFLFKKPKISYKYILAGIVIGILPLIPYFIYQIQYSCPDCYSLFSAGKKLQSFSSLEIFQKPFQILGQGGFNQILGVEDMLKFSKEYSIVFKIRWILYLFYLIIPIGALIFYKTYKKTSFFLPVLILTCIIYFFVKVEPQMHYFILFLPFLALFAGTFFDWFVKKNTYLKSASVIVFAFLLLALIAFNWAFFDFLKKNEGTGGDYGQIYSQNKIETDKNLKEFTNDKDYDEIFLTYHLPLKYMFGFLPLSKMIYPENLPAEKILDLENKLALSNKDPRIKLMLLSNFTKTEPDINTIKFLKAKSDQIPQYRGIFDEVLGYYKAKNFLKDYRSEKFDLDFFYPEHWKLEENSTGVILQSDDYTILIRRVSKNAEVVCIKGKCDKNIIKRIEQSLSS